MKRILHMTLLVSLLLSAAANVALYHAAKTFYTREAKFRLTPVGTPSFATSGNDSAPVLLLLGDSRCAQWPLQGSADFRTTNAGVGNETTAQVLLRTMATMEKANPTVVVIQAGINDLKVIPLLPEKKDEITFQCVSNLMAMAETCTRHGANVILLSILPAGEVELSRRLVWSDDVTTAVISANKELKKRCSGKPRIRFLDLTGDVSIDSDYVDTLHFNPAFYSRMTPNVLNAAKEQLTGTR